MKITTKAVALSAALAICAAPSGALIANSNHTRTIDYAAIPCAVINTSPNEGDKYIQNKWAIDKILAESAWKECNGGGSIALKIGIIDSGIMGTHEDLATKVDKNLSQDFTGGNSPLTDSTGHGTAVAGIIGAARNNKGTVGICYSSMLVSYKAETTAQVVSAIYYAKASGVNLLNISLDVTVSDDLKTAVQSYPGLIVCAAGNKNKNIDSDKTSLAALPYDNIISVGATNVEDEISSASNYGKTAVDVFAPGEGVWTTTNDGEYATQTGTSFAAPYVTGVAGLLMSKTSYSVAQIKEAIIDNVDKLSVCSDKCVSGGRLNAYNAMHKNHTYTVYTPYSSYHTITCTYCSAYKQEAHKWVSQMDSLGNIKTYCSLCKYVKDSSLLSVCGDDDCDVLDVILSTMDNESECLIHN